MELDDFLFNIHDTNSIVTGGRVKEGVDYCPVGCMFCICKGDKTSIGYKIPFITDEQFDQGLKFISWAGKKEILLGDGISKLSAEAFAHPKIYTFLDRLSNLFPEHKILVITTGIFIDENKIDFINNLKNVHLSLSVNTLNPELRLQLMPHSYLNKIKVLIKELENVSVALFDMGSVDVFKKDLEELYRLKSTYKGIQLRRIEHTKYHNKKAIEMSVKSINNFENSLAYIRKEYSGVVQHWSPYVEYLIDDGFKEEQFVRDYVSGVIRYCDDYSKEKIVLCMAESAYKSWSKWLKGISNAFPILVKNHTYGGSITNAGLMLFKDIRLALKNINLDSVDKILIPKIMLNNACQDLSGEFLINFIQNIGIPTSFI